MVSRLSALPTLNSNWANIDSVEDIFNWHPYRQRPDGDADASLRQILNHWYVSKFGLDSLEAVEYVDAYILKIMKECEKHNAIHLPLYP